MLYEINNIYFHTKNPKLDHKLDRYLRILDTDGRGLKVQRKKVQDNRISNEEPLDIVKNLEQSSNSFLDPAIAVADIDTFLYLKPKH